MDTSSLRWILVIAGIAILAGLFLFGNPDKKRKPRASRKRAHAARIRREPVLDADTVIEDEPVYHDERQTELAIDSLPDPDARLEPHFDSLDDGMIRDEAPTVPEVPPPDKIITLFIQARDNHFITGVELLDVSLKSGLVFGQQGIFHRIHEEDVEPVFSMEASSNVPRSAQLDKRRTIGVRIPDNNVVQGLLEVLDEPLLSSSLILPDPEGKIFDSEDLYDEVYGQIDLFVDAGYCPLEPTTLIDLTSGQPECLRRGAGVIDFL